MAEDSGSGDAPGRRDFLHLAIVGTATALGVVGSYPAARFLAPMSRPILDRAQVGKLDEFPVGSGRSVALGERVALVIRLADGSFRAFIAICSHLGCVVGYSAARNHIECHCHNGVFSVDGQVVSGPPPRDLEPLRVTVDDGIVVVSQA